MSLKDIYRRDVVTIGKSASAREAARLMNECHVNCLVVTDRRDALHVKPEGIITDRDLMIECVLKGRDADRVHVGDVLQPRPITIRSDANSYEVVHMMEEFGISRIPVVTPSGDLEGIIAFEDIYLLTESGQDRAEQYMM